MKKMRKILGLMMACFMLLTSGVFVGKVNAATAVDNLNQVSDMLSWSTADNNVGLNYDSSKSASISRSAVFNNQLYVTWQETNGTSNQIRVKKFDGTSWTSADNNTSLNYDTSKNAESPVPIVFNNQLYVIWYEYSGTSKTTLQIRVKKFDGTSWTSADNNTSLNYNTSKSACQPSPIVFNNQLYVAWDEDNGSSAYQIRVKKFDGTSWTSADSNTSLNYDTSKNTSGPVPIVFNNQLYMAWDEDNGSSAYQIRVKKFDGTSWTSTNNNTSLNYDTSKSAFSCVPIVFNNQLYVTWYENNGTANQIRAKKFDGTSWTSADNNTGLNYNTSKSAFICVPIVFNNQLYVTWYENNGTAYQIRAKKFDGTSWTSVDNNTSLNYDNSKDAFSPVPIVFNNQLYVTWGEYDGTTYQIRVKKYSNIIASISLDKTDINTVVGQTYTLVPTILPENVTNKNVTWKSSNPTIATVDATGKVTGVKPGTAIITVTTVDGGKTATCTVTVNDKKPTLNIVASKEKVKVSQEFTTDAVFQNVYGIYAEDFKITYDSKLFDYEGFDQIAGYKVYNTPEDNGGTLRFIISGQGKDKVINGDKVVLKLKFKAKAIGTGKVDALKARVADTEKEYDLDDINCLEDSIIVENGDVNKNGEYSLLDLALDGYFYGMNASETDTQKYNADQDENGKVDDVDLTTIVNEMLKNTNYKPNNV
jgi:uncharacterized protein YjdB